MLYILFEIAKTLHIHCFLHNCTYGAWSHHVPMVLDSHAYGTGSVTFAGR